MQIKKVFATSALAATLALAGLTAHAGNGSSSQTSYNGVAGGAVIGVNGQAYTGTVTSGVTNTLQGSAVSVTRVNGNGISKQSTVSTGSGTVSAGGIITPTGVTANTSQVTTSNVVSHGFSVGQTPALDSAGLLVNGTAGLAQADVAAGVVGTHTQVAAGGSLGIFGAAGITGISGVSGTNGYNNDNNHNHH